MLFNGKVPGKAIKRKMGFVLQDDRLFPDLTVWETLMFAAQLRLPKTMTMYACACISLLESAAAFVLVCFRSVNLCLSV